MTSKELKRLLQASGCIMVRQGKGSHEIWYSPQTNRTFAVPHPKNPIPVGTVKSIKRQAGI